ncbi:MAG TPA: hypothetical protein VH351_10980 [Bryobacteraceae bacterium]|jgi:hypothetical protein|nr:hypothetical protein [Bryobacteraceae bacterium]
MNSAYGKILAAFTAGLALALGGAALYVKMSNRTASTVAVAHFTTTPASAQLTPEKLPDAGDAQAVSEEPSPAPAPAASNVEQAASNSDAAQEQTAPDQASPAPVVKPTAPPLMPAAPTRMKVSPQPQKQPKTARTPTVIAKNTPPQPEYLPAPPPDDPVPAAAATPQAAAPQPDSRTMVTPQPAADQPQTTAGPKPQTAPAPSQPPHQPRIVTIQPGTKLVVRVSQEISTDRAAGGDAFLGILESPIVLDNALIAEKGSRVRGRVVGSQKGHGGGVAALSLTLTEINTTDGQQVKVVTSSYREQGPRSTDTDLAKIGGGAALGAVIGGVSSGGKGAAIGAGLGGAAGAGAVLLTRPKPAVVEEETKLDFELTEPVVITERLN